ncbi:MAG TPA: 50S ribosomal protein L10 [Candidatus Acidoferrales bacterium]|nr:50S ribosomal protein L10 [Candidatus Acidoferrales bacterium]
MKRNEKEQIVAEVTDLMSNSSSLFFTDFAGMTVAESNELRREFQKNGVKYKVVKNTLIKKAMLGFSSDQSVNEYMVGQTAVAFGSDDPTTPAKVLKKFFDKNQKPTTKAFVVDKQVFDGKRLAEFASMPSKAEVVASILGSLQSPIAGIAGSISAVMRDLVMVIDAVGEKLPQQAS